MMKSLTLGALLGGLVAFGWSAVSWMVLTWHYTPMMSFTNEDAVAQVLAENALRGGMYWLPGPPPDYASLKGDARKAADAAMQAKMKRGPFMLGVVQADVQDDMVRQMAGALLFDILAALLITMLVMKTSRMTYGGRVMFIVTAALAVAIIAEVPNWIWFHYGTRFVLVNMADIVVAWLLAGLVIAKVGVPKAA